MVFLPLLFVALTLQDHPPEPVCAVEVRWVVEGPRFVSRSVPRSFSLFAAVGRSRSANCVPADLSLTVAYFDANSDLVCAGTVPRVAALDASQIVHLEFRPVTLTELVRWRNGSRTLQRALPLTCMNEDGTAALQVGELDRARTMRVYATVTPPAGGLATSELHLTLNP